MWMPSIVMALHPASVGMGLMLNRKQKGKDMVNKIEIRPADGRKSFYGKAKMVQYDGTVYWTVRSYGTDVALMRKTDEGMVEVVRLWMGYSYTTMRHINSAMSMLGASHRLCKKEWESITYKESMVIE